MEEITLTSNPNTYIPVAVGGFAYGIYLRYFRGMQYATVTDSVGNIISGPVRCCNKKWLMPYPARGYVGAGNFMFIDSEGQYPMFENFGKTCRLVYFTLEEIVNGSAE